jgi:tetratricopeptide (TPR) repeat protein
MKLNNTTAFIGILIVAFVIYFPCLNAGFLLYDDPEYVTENYFLQDFSFTGIVNLFIQKVYDLYIPLTWLSYWIEQNIFKFSAHGMHVTNIVLHSINSFLVFKLFVKLFHKKIPAILIAILFLIHPQHVESVAWIAERKDVLYTFFYLLATLFYIDFKSSGNRKYYIGCFLFFVLSCLSKPMAISLPIVISLIDYFIYNEKTIKKHANKIPFIIISALFSLIAIKFMSANSAANEMSNYSTLNKLIFPFYELSFYVFKLILPINLTAIYQTPDSTIGLHVYVYAAFFIILTFFAFLKGNKYAKLAMLLYIFILLPVLQLIPNANALVADRYAYVSSIVPFAVVCFFADKNPFFQKKWPLIFSCIILILSIASYNRCKIWKNDVSLFTNVISKNKKSHTAYANLGMYYLKEGNNTEALINLKQAVTLKPNSSIILTNYAWALAIDSQTDSSLTVLVSSVEIDPLYFKTWNNLGVVLGIKNKYQLSLKCLLFAQKLNPYNAQLYYNMAITYINLSENKQAIRCYQKAAQMGLAQAQQFLSANNLNW